MKFCLVVCNLWCVFFSLFGGSCGLIVKVVVLISG